MSMKKNLFLIFSLLLWVPVALPAQVVEKVLDIFHADSLQASEIKADSDSLHLAAVRKELATAKLNEANLRMEIEQMKLAAYAADSVKLASQKQRIDSLRQVTLGRSCSSGRRYSVLPLCQAWRPFSAAAGRKCITRHHGVGQALQSAS